MPSLRDIKRRIKSVKNTQQITKAMKLVAASKLRKAQDAILNRRHYALKLMEVLNHLSARCNSDLHPLLDQREEKRVLLLVISSDKGLCGGFNTNINRKVLDVLKVHENHETAFIAIGKKGKGFLTNRGKAVHKSFVDWTKDFDYLKAVEIGEELADLFVKKEVDKVYMIYNEFKSVIQQKVIVEQLLPIVPEKLSADGDKDGAVAVDYIYEPDEESILETLLQRYMAVEVYRACLESIASEHGSRMTAMDNATRNAKEMIGNLTLNYNRARQAYITKELIEVVNGAEALKG